MILAARRREPTYVLVEKAGIWHLGLPGQAVPIAGLCGRTPVDGVVRPLAARDETGPWCPVCCRARVEHARWGRS